MWPTKEWMGRLERYGYRLSYDGLVRLLMEHASYRSRPRSGPEVRFEGAGPVEVMRQPTLHLIPVDATQVAEDRRIQAIIARRHRALEAVAVVVRAAQAPFFDGTVEVPLRLRLEDVARRARWTPAIVREVLLGKTVATPKGRFRLVDLVDPTLADDGDPAGAFVPSAPPPLGPTSAAERFVADVLGSV